jgi:hypothetical protein
MLHFRSKTSLSHFNKIIGIIFVAVIFNNGLLFAQHKSDTLIKSKEDELARVSILSFEDRTGSSNYQYLSESLSDAINTSMLKDFSYSRVDPKDVKKAIFEIQQEILKSKIENKDRPIKRNRVISKIKIEEIKKKEKTDGKIKSEEQVEKKREKTEVQLQQDEDQLNLVKKVAKNLNSDIVIYGNYWYDVETNELIFSVTLYLALSNSVKELDENRNVVDNSLFNATEKVSKNLVNEIHSMIEEAEKIASLKKGEEVYDKKDETPIKPGEKVALTRKVAMASSFDWQSKKFSLGISPGFFLNLPLANGTNEICGTCQIQAGITARFWVIPRFYLGAKLNFGEMWSVTTPMGSSPLLDGFVLLGYSLPVDRWLFSADLDAGYFLIKDKKWGLQYNPAFGARLGVEFLLTPVFSTGLSANGFMYYDIPKPLIFGGLALTFSYVL